MVPASYRCNNIQQLQAEHFNEYLQQQKLLINHRVSWIDRYIDIQVRSAFSFCHFFSLTIGIIARNKQYNTHIYTHFTIIFAAKRCTHSVLFPSFCPNEPGQHSSQVVTITPIPVCRAPCFRRTVATSATAPLIYKSPNYSSPILLYQQQYSCYLVYIPAFYYTLYILWLDIKILRGFY